MIQQGYSQAGRIVFIIQDNSVVHAFFQTRTSADNLDLKRTEFKHDYRTALVLGLLMGCLSRKTDRLRCQAFNCVGSLVVEWLDAGRVGTVQEILRIPRSSSRLSLNSPSQSAMERCRIL